MPLLCQTKVIIVDHDALESKLIAIICPFDSPSSSHSEQTNCDEDINGNGKGYFLCCIHHNVSILACPSRLLAMQESCTDITIYLYIVSTALLPPDDVLSSDIHASTVREKGRSLESTMNRTSSI